MLKAGSKVEGDILEDYGNGYYLVRLEDENHMAYSTIKLQRSCIFEVIKSGKVIHLKVAEEQISRNLLDSLRTKSEILSKLDYNLSLEILNNLQSASLAISDEKIINIANIINENDIEHDTWLPLLIRLMNDEASSNNLLPAFKTIRYFFSHDNIISEDSLFLLNQLINNNDYLFFNLDKKNKDNSNNNFYDYIELKIHQQNPKFTFSNDLNIYDLLNKAGLGDKVPLRWYIHTVQVENTLYKLNLENELDIDDKNPNAFLYLVNS